MHRWWEVVTRRLDELFAGLPTHLTVEQLAEVLGVARNTAYRWLNDGVVPAYKVGTSWVILRDEIRDFLERNRVGPAVDDEPEEHDEQREQDT